MSGTGTLEHPGVLWHTGDMGNHNRTGGGVGSNQYQVRGTSRHQPGSVPVPSVPLMDQAHAPVASVDPQASEDIIGPQIDQDTEEQDDELPPLADTTEGWYYEPADREVGIMQGAWVHEDCPSDGPYNTGEQDDDEIRCGNCRQGFYIPNYPG